MEEQRVQKIIAQAGIASRRAADQMIEEGRVTVNGTTATPGQKADPYNDEIKVDGRTLPKPEKLYYIALHKPRGVLSTAKRQEQIDRPTVVEMVDVDARLYPVGRLDLNSEGLILLTNDGELTNKITHPRYGHEKTYKVSVEGRISDDKIRQWERGMTLPDGFQTQPCRVMVLESNRDSTWLRVVIREGHKRQIRSIAEMLGHPVQRLIRTHIGALELGDMPPGQWRNLNDEEIQALRSTTAPTKQKKQRSRSRRRNE